MAAYNKFQNFVENLGKAVHNFDAAGNVLKVYASDATPDAALDAAARRRLDVPVPQLHVGRSRGS